jgi:flagellar P-ring protein precursor FlgI
MNRSLLVGIALVALAAPAQPQRISDLTVHDGDVPVRLVGYGLVVGLDGTGDRSFGSGSGPVMTVQSVANLLRRFDIEVPSRHMRLRNVAAVLVTAELSPWLRPGGRFEVQVSSLGDASSLRGGVLWMTPLIAGPGQPPLATAQGPLVISEDGTGRAGRLAARLVNSARIPEGGVLERPLGTLAQPPAPRLVLRQPDLALADRIASTINKAFGDSTARVVDPGLVELKPPQDAGDNIVMFLARVDTLNVAVTPEARIVIDARTGTVVAGGEIPVTKATVSVRGITVRIGDTPSGADSTAGALGLPGGSTVQSIAAGLQAVGARSADVAAVFEALGAVGALRARVIVR